MQAKHKTYKGNRERKLDIQIPEKDIEREGERERERDDCPNL